MTLKIIASANACTDPPMTPTPEIDPPHRANADTCANHLVNKATYPDYPTAPKEGWPIATGLIEGACRHLRQRRDRGEPSRRRGVGRTRSGG